MTREFPDAGLQSPEAGPRIFSVSELTCLIKGLLETELAQVWVEGEVSAFIRAQSGHVYFTLKDEASQIKAVYFRFRQSNLKFKLENGLKVLVRGQVSVYAPRGEYQLVVESVEPRGLGALQLAFEQLKARLRAEGLFDEGRKRPIPAMPDTVGVVTSPTGAAIRDIIHVMRRRFASVGIILYPVKVQGEGAAAEIAEGIRAMNRWGRADVIIVGRGGGSLEDLWAFNEEEVARAIYASTIPVISAVGHEIDFTIADFTADLRAATPSAAAELVVKNRLHLARELQTQRARLEGNWRRIHARAGAMLKSLAERAALTKPERFLMAPRQRLDEGLMSLQRVARHLVVSGRFRLEQLGGRLSRFDPRARLAGYARQIPLLAGRLDAGMNAALKSKRDRLAGRAAQLEALSPLAVLSRGYSICRRLPDLSIVGDARRVEEGDMVQVLLHRGALDCRITTVKTGEKSL